MRIRSRISAIPTRLRMVPEADPTRAAVWASITSESFPFHESMNGRRPRRVCVATEDPGQEFRLVIQGAVLEPHRSVR